MSAGEFEGERRTNTVVGDYVLVRSHRRSVGLEVRPDATLVVRVPVRAPLYVVDAVLLEKSAWIADKLQQARTRNTSLPRHDFLTGERFPYLGRDHPFVVAAFQDKPLVFDERTGFTLDMAVFDRGEHVFESWYRTRARELLTERVQLYAPRVGVHIPRLRITGAERRWGSCSATGTVSFAWRLIMAPLDAIDYVVVHELAHVHQLNHSPAFWAVVSAVMPDYAQRRRWLKEHGPSLTI